MKILAVDTSAKSCSAAIIDNNLLLAEMSLISDQTHSKHLMEMISKVINLSGILFSELDGFAVVKGPGSYTGLRIGITTIKGLALASGKPVVGISLLDAMAMQANFSSYLICSLVNAFKNEAFFAFYKLNNGTLDKQCKEQVSTLDQILSSINEQCIFAGDNALLHQTLIKSRLHELAHFTLPCQNAVKAFTVAKLSLHKFKNNETDDPETIVPNYLQQPYATR